MKYWRMQLHPDDSGNSISHSASSLSSGFIGLDFEGEIGDLEFEKSENIPKYQKDYVAFEKDMSIGDKVLIISHHFPFAVCTISGEYNYIKEPVPELGLWFRHFRRVENIRYYADYKTNANSWQSITMTDTISPLKNEGTLSLDLIKKMYD